MTTGPTVHSAFQNHPNPPPEPLAGWSCATFIVVALAAWLGLVASAVFYAVAWFVV